MGCVNSPYIEQNSSGQDCYLIQYDEDQWNRYDKTRQLHCFAEWEKKATALGAEYVVLRLIPDPIFPSGDKTVPYVARSIAIRRDDFNPIRTSMKLTAEIDGDTWDRATEMQRGDLKAKARTQLGMIAMQHGEGCTYEIFTRENKIAKRVETGKF
jgi:hypothetical protein